MTKKAFINSALFRILALARVYALTDFYVSAYATREVVTPPPSWEASFVLQSAYNNASEQVNSLYIPEIAGRR